MDTASLAKTGPDTPRNWSDGPTYRQVILALGFLAAFLLSDGSSTASQGWEGAPPWYLPVGLSLALLLSGGLAYAPLVLCCSLIAAVVNYHRPCSPGAVCREPFFFTSAT